MPCCCGCFIYLSRFINWFNSRFHKIPWVCKRILILELTSLARFFIQPHVISFNLTLSSYKLQTSLYQTGNHIFSCLAIWNNTLSLIVTNETNQCNNHRVKFICQSCRIKVDFQCREFVYVRKTCVQFSTTLFFFACENRRPVRLSWILFNFSLHSRDCNIRWKKNTTGNVTTFAQRMRFCAQTFNSRYDFFWRAFTCID